MIELFDGWYLEFDGEYYLLKRGIKAPLGDAGKFHEIEYCGHVGRTLKKAVKRAVNVIVNDTIDEYGDGALSLEDAYAIYYRYCNLIEDAKDDAELTIEREKQRPW